MHWLSENERLMAPFSCEYRRGSPTKEGRALAFLGESGSAIGEHQGLVDIAETLTGHEKPLNPDGDATAFG